MHTVHTMDKVHTLDKEKKTQDKEMTCTDTRTDTCTGEHTHKDINNGNSAQRIVDSGHIGQ